MLMILAAIEEEYGKLNASELEDLMQGLVRGDQEALSQLYHYARTAVYGLALSIVRNGHDADDITQDTFVRAWEKAEQYRPQGTPMAWLLSITRNLALMKLREQKRTQDLPPEDWAQFSVASHDVTTEDRTVLGAAMTILSDEERQIILLHVTSGLKHREIASLFGVASLYCAVQISPRLEETQRKTERR